MFAVHPQDGDNTKVKVFTLNASTGTRVWYEGKRIKGWTIVGDLNKAFNYSESENGDYFPVYSGGFTGSFTNGEGVDTVGWFKSQTGSFDLFVLFTF